MKKLIALSALTFTSALFAADVAYSPPVGGMTITVPAGATRTVVLPLLHSSVGAGIVIGQITGVGSNYIDVANAAWTPSAFSTASNPYYIRIKSGAASGRILMVTTPNNTDSRVYVNNDGVDLTVAGGPVAGDMFELVLADTLLTFFGTDTLQGGADATAADNVSIWGGASWQTYYYNTTRSRWELRGLGTVSANNVALRPDRGFILSRRAATDLTMYVTGRVPDRAPVYVQTRPGTTFLSVGTPTIQTLGDLALQTRAQGWVSGTSAATADTIQVWGGASWQTYYYHSVNNRWQLSGVNTSANGASLAGRPIVIRRTTAAASAAERLVQMPMPYTIN